MESIPNYPTHHHIHLSTDYLASSDQMSLIDYNCILCFPFLQNIFNFIRNISLSGLNLQLNSILKIHLFTPIEVLSLLL